MRLNLVAIFIFAFGLLALNACTKTSSSSTVQIQLPDFNNLSSAAGSNNSKVLAKDVSAFSSVFLSRVMINVTGSGISRPIVIILTGNDPLHPLPQSVPVKIPTGPGRLIQVMVVTKTAELTGGTQLSGGDDSQLFYYGDTTANVSGDTSIDLFLSKLTADTGAQGSVAGRYLDTSSDGPTGLVAVTFQPPNNRPPMIVAATEIHGGWFEFPAFEGLALNYVTESGRKLLSGFDFANFSATGTNNLVASVPTGYKSVFLSSVEQYRVGTKPSKLVYGFFGDAISTSGKQMCYDTAGGINLNGLYTTQAPLTTTTLVGWAVNPSPVLAGVASGGISVNSCSGSYPDSWLKLNPAQLADYHGNLGFKAPFQSFASSLTGSPTLLDVIPNPTSGSLTLNWQWLPGVTDTVAPDRVSGVGVFMRTSTTPFTSNGKDYEVDGLIACNRLTDASLLAQPFQLVARVPNSGSGAQSTSIAGVSPLDYAAGKVQVVLCPYSNARPDYFRSAVGAQGDSSNAPVGLAAFAVDGSQSTTGSPKHLQTTVCSPILISAVQSFSQPVKTGVARSLTVGTTSSQDLLYTSEACTAGTGSGQQSITLPNFVDHQYVWFKTTQASGSGYLTITDTSASALAPTNFYYTIVSATLASQLLTLTQSETTKNACVEALLVATDASGAPAQVSSAWFAAPSVYPQYYSDSLCAGMAMTGNPPLPTTSLPIHFRNTGSSSPLSVAPTSSSMASTPSSPVTFNPPGTPWGLKVWMSNRMSFSGTPDPNCLQVSVSLTDVNGNVTPGASSNVNLSATNGSFYSGSCGGSLTPTPSVMVTGGDYIKNSIYYFKPASAGAASITATAMGMIPSTLSINVAP